MTYLRMLSASTWRDKAHVPPGVRQRCAYVFKQSGRGHAVEGPPCYPYRIPGAPQNDVAGGNSRGSPKCRGGNLTRVTWRNLTVSFPDE